MNRVRVAATPSPSARAAVPTLDNSPRPQAPPSSGIAPDGSDATATRRGAGFRLAGDLRTIGASFGTATRVDATIVRARPVSLNAGRLFVLALACVFMSVAGACAWVWASARHQAHDASEQVLAFADWRLRDIEIEMRQVADAAYSDMNWTACAQPLATALTRASVASTLVRRFVLSADQMDGSCRPEGPGSTPFFPYEPTTRIAITSSGEIVSRLTAALRRDASGRIVSAVLDPRAFNLEGTPYAAWGDAGLLRPALLSADGRRLARLGGAELEAPVVDDLRSTASSASRDVRVRVDVDRSELVERLRRAGLVAAGVTVLLLLALVAVFWRRVTRRAQLVHRIRRGLQKREFEPFVQPILDLRSGRCAGLEVLMRWQHPHRGTLPPSEFIEEAERTGLIAGMSELVMTRAAHRLAPIAREHSDLYFAFNLTPQQLIHPQLPRRLAEIFRDDTLPRDRVLLEITEREFVDPVAADSLAALHAGGWRVAVDDFGTGHSSLAALEQLAIDRLKIDRAFVSTISEETVSRPVLEAIIQLADRLSLPTIAEGIETQAQLEYLAARGVPYGQGYLIGRPMNIAAFQEWLARHNAGTPARVAATSARTARTDERPDKVAQRLWNAMRVPGGLDIRDRMFHLRTYKACFVGRQAVDWMVQHEQMTRAEAVLQGRRPIALGLMTHVVNEHDFEDAELFYQLATPTDASLASASAPAALRTQLLAQHGVRLSRHSRGLVRHDACTTGRALVRWIMATHRVSRQTARQWALQLMREGVIRHVYDDRPFSDDRTLYRVG
jgi:EAL domain-containing protein (putative c-di-GMP-specific phosphodiesterase class I)